MKTLKKIILHDAIVLKEKEMKNIFGGSGAGPCPSSTCSGECLTDTYAKGTCKRNIERICYCSEDNKA
ncbi:MAG: hypothetical protein PHS04_12425 [Tissierellia bacterium]|nr:hypothetical protein [Tissierellia bacterium]